MPTLTVGPNSTFPSITAAMAAAAAGDTILLETGYINETATVTHNAMIISGDATSTGIILQLAPGIATFSLAGAAPINVFDAVAAADGNGIVGNDGNNIITVSEGADAVNGGLGTDDRLVVDYHLATGAITGDSTSNVTESGGGARSVTITNGTFEHFTILTGSNADTITTGDGDDIINTGEGAGTVTAGQGANTIIGGSGADTFTALDGGNFIDGGDGFNILTSGGGNDIILSGVGADTIVAGGGNDLITVRGGADTVSSGAGDDRLTVNYSASGTAVTGGVTGGDLATGYTGHIADLSGNTVDFTATENMTISTGGGEDNITTGDGIDELSGGGGNDTLASGAGNDGFTGGAGDDAMDGGAGTDTARYSGARSDYTITVLSPTLTQVVDNRPGSPDGTDMLTNFEFLAFAINNLPVISSPSALVVAENATAVTTLVATDADLDPLTYSIVGGADAALFALDPVTHALSFLVGPDFETPADANHDNRYEVTVQAFDGTAGANQAITVDVTNVKGVLVSGNALNNRIDGTHTVGAQPFVTGEEDILRGKQGNDKISGLGGNDSINGGVGNDRLFGNAGEDVLRGGTGTDKLNGGRGNDVLVGGLGDDMLVFDSALLNNVDAVRRFGVLGDDTMLLDNAVFTRLSGGLGTLTANQFHLGAAAGDANDHIIYHRPSGSLFYDADGSGAIAAVQFAQLTPHAGLSNADFLVI